MGRIRLQAVQDINVGRALPDGHHGDDTLTCRVGFVVGADESVPLLDDILRRGTVHLRLEVRELQPVKPVLAVALIADADCRHKHLIRFGDIPSISLCRFMVVLHASDDIILPERVVHPAVVRLQIDTLRLRIVVVHLHLV